MLLKIEPHISDCLERARLSHERAAKAADPILKGDFLEMERTWLHLAESYRTVERLQAFLADAHSKQTVAGLEAASDTEIEQLAERIIGNAAEQH